MTIQKTIRQTFTAASIVTMTYAGFGIAQGTSIN